MKKSHSLIIGLLVGIILTVPFLSSQPQQKPKSSEKSHKSVKAASNTVSFSATPASNANLPVGQFDIVIRMETNQNDIAGVELVLKSSSASTLELIGFTPAAKPIPNYKESFMTISNQSLSSGELYRYAAVNPTNSVFTGDTNGILTLGTLHARMKKIGTANLLVDANSSVVTTSTTPISVANAGSFIGTYTVPAPPTATLIPPTATPVPAVPTATPVLPTPTSVSVYTPPQVVTPIPSNTPPAGPTATTAPACPPKSAGNANAGPNCVIDSGDYDIWASEASGTSQDKAADFNGDGKVDILDFNIWRIGLFNIGATRK